MVDNINALADIVLNHFAQSRPSMNKTSQKRGINAPKVGSIWLFLIVAMAVLSLVALSVGSAIPIPEILRALLSGEENTVKVILYNLRLPRLLLALLIGASLSASGALAAIQMRNPLADPGTIGVSAGAGTAATTILLIFPHLTNSVPIFAFAGASLACVLIYSLAWKGGVDPVRIILSGVAINSVLGAYNSLLQMLNSDSLEGVLAFMNGSLSGRSWQQVQILAAYAGVGLVLAFACIKSANTLQLGDEMAKSLGVKAGPAAWGAPRPCPGLPAAATVSVAGMIGFVGLAVPHIARILVGSDYKAMLPTSVGARWCCSWPTPSAAPSCPAWKSPWASSGVRSRAGRSSQHAGKKGQRARAVTRPGPLHVAKEGKAFMEIRAESWKSPRRLHCGVKRYDAIRAKGKIT